MKILPVSTDTWGTTPCTSKQIELPTLSLPFRKPWACGTAHWLFRTDSCCCHLCEHACYSLCENIAQKEEKKVKNLHRSAFNLKNGVHACRKRSRRAIPSDKRATVALKRTANHIAWVHSCFHRYNAVVVIAHLMVLKARSWIVVRMCGAALLWREECERQRKATQRECAQKKTSSDVSLVAGGVVVLPWCR